MKKEAVCLILTYEGHDITNYVSVTKCMCRDASCGRADSMELEFEHAAAWYQWGPKLDDELSASLNGYSTGTMYLNAVQPEGDKFRIYATALPSAARRRSWDTYQGMTFKTILERCAAEIGMEGNLYGMEGNYRYAYLTRDNEGSAAFLNRLGLREGAAIKATNGKIRAVSIEYAQSLDPVHTYYIDTTRTGVTHTRRDNKKHNTLTVLSPYARVLASDSAADFGSPITICGLQAKNAVQAGRWARGLLLTHNRQQEHLVIKDTFNPLLSALCRVNVNGPTDANGQWIIDEAEHDLINETTSIRTFRVITTIH